MWNEIVAELDMESVEPVDFDMDALQLLTRGMEEKTLECLELQEVLPLV